MHRLEQGILELEQRQTELTAELEKSETYEKPGRAQEVNRELVDIQEKLSQLSPAWEQEATKLVAFE